MRADKPEYPPPTSAEFELEPRICIDFGQVSTSDRRQLSYSFRKAHANRKSSSLRRRTRSTLFSSHLHATSGATPATATTHLTVIMIAAGFQAAYLLLHHLSFRRHDPVLNATRA